MSLHGNFKTVQEGQIGIVCQSHSKSWKFRESISKYKNGVEGDTPSFLYVMPTGLNDPLIPNQVSWGGYFEWGVSPDDATNAYNNHKGKANEISNKYLNYFYPATFNNFVPEWTGQPKEKETETR